ncbi:MAG: hypothetical protein GX149_03290 [Acholeplasmataceae bacterium]|nr:hypothetical protein [Acholeplasmataceae bacterium]
MISLYLDDFPTIEDLIEAARTLRIKRIPLRKIENNSLYDLELAEVETINNQLRKAKIRVLYLDIDAEFDLYELINMEHAAAICKVLNCRDLVINLPNFTDFNAEKEQLIHVVKELLEVAKKNKLKLHFKINYEINSAYIAFLIKEIAEILFVFNPGKCYETHKSITTYYRLIRRKVSLVIFYDVDENKKPALLGYGKALILDMIDKLNIDKYKGYIIYDSNLKEYAMTREKGTKKRFRLPFFRRKKRKAHLKIDEKLQIQDSKGIDFIEILESQLKLIQLYKKW